MSRLSCHRHRDHIDQFLTAANAVNEWKAQSRGTRRTAEYAGLPSLQDLAESRLVQSAHGEMMRLGEQSCDVFFGPGRLAVSCILFDMLPEVVLDENWMESQRTCPASVLGDIGGAEANGCDRQLL